MTFTDPPYNVDYEGKTARKLKLINDALGAEFYNFLRGACANLLAVTTGAIYICMSSSELHTLYRAFTDAGGHWSTFVVWAKDRFTLGRIISVNTSRSYMAGAMAWITSGAVPAIRETSGRSKDPPPTKCIRLRSR